MIRHTSVVVVLVFAIGFPAVGQDGTDAERYPSDLSLAERAALYGQARLLPRVEQDGFILQADYLTSHVQLSANLTDIGSRTLGLSGHLRWSKEAGDFVISNIAIPRAARDAEGESFLDRWIPDPPPAASYGTQWRVDAYRTNAKPEQDCPFTLQFAGLRRLPETIGVLTAELPVWHVVEAETITIPLEVTPTPVQLRADWTAEVFEEKGFDGTPFVVVRVAYWGEQVEVVPDHISLPHLLGPESCDWLGPDGKRDPQLTWYPTRISRDEARDFADRGARIWRWGFQIANNAAPAGRSIRIRIVDDLEYDPIPFEIRDVPLLAERPLPPDRQVPKRVAERGPLSVEFKEAGQSNGLFSHQPGEPEATVFLRGTLRKAPTAEPLGVLLVPIVEVAEDQDGRSILDGYSPQKDPLRNSMYNDWLDLERDYTQQRHMQVALNFRVHPGTTSLKRLEAKVPAWRATSVREHSVPIQATARPAIDEDGLRIQVVSVQPRDEADVVVTVRVEVEDASELGGLPMPWIVSPAIVHASGRYDDGSQLLRARQSGQEAGWRWVEFTCSSSPLTLNAEGAAVRVRVVSEAEFEPLEFELTDFPLRP
ncbi:MAG: hypothetical protein ACF8R9_06770 [Phycisphaerales bacterium JB054]